MTEQEIIQGLIARDDKVTSYFFFTRCQPLFYGIISDIFDHKADYDELVNELYAHLMANDARRLRQFKYESSLYQWLKTTAIRFCLRLKIGGTVIDVESQEPLDNKNRNTDSTESSQAKMDVEALLFQMRNQRYAKVIRMLIIDDMEPEKVAQELAVTVDNLYNIKRRAMAALTNVALKDKRHYERK